MSYSNYDLTIRHIYKVELRGWPPGIKFTSPSNISALGEIKILHSAIKSGKCTWAAMSRAHVAELAEKIKGKGVKKRATHSDKGKKRSQKGKENAGLRGGEDDKQPARKKARNAKKLPVMYHSQSVIDSDTDA